MTKQFLIAGKQQNIPILDLQDLRAFQFLRDWLDLNRREKPPIPHVLCTANPDRPAPICRCIRMRRASKHIYCSVIVKKKRITPMTKRTYPAAALGIQLAVRLADRIPIALFPCVQIIRDRQTDLDDLPIPFS